MHRTFAARVAVALSTVVLAALVSATRASAASAPAPARAPQTETATFAGGCFWSMETLFEGVPGVRTVTSGYTGGAKKHPTYEEVCSETTGHLEAVQIVFDPRVISYMQLLDRFWHGVDPTQADGQLFDIGDSYRTEIFYSGDVQKQQALASKAAIESSGVLHQPIATRIAPATDFWPAEGYHQDYAKKNPVRYQVYRAGSGRDRRLAEIWGSAAVKPTAH